MNTKTENHNNVNESMLKVKDPEVFNELDSVTKEYHSLVTTTSNQFELMAITAKAIAELRNRLSDELVTKLCTVKNSRLGFKTDENDGSNGNKPLKYSLSVFRECFIESALRGTRLIGNEFNVIAYGYYITKEGYQGLMKRDKRFSKLKLELGVPDIQGNRALVEFEGSWLFENEADSLRGVIPIRVNKYMGDDAILGKVDRKARHRIFHQATGDVLPEGDVSEMRSAQHEEKVSPVQGTLIDEVSDSKD